MDLTQVSFLLEDLLERWQESEVEVKPKTITVLGLMQIAFLTGSMLLAALFLRYRAWGYNFQVESQPPTEVLLYLTFRDYGFFLYPIPLIWMVLSLKLLYRPHPPRFSYILLIGFCMFFLIALMLVGIGTVEIPFFHHWTGGCL